MDPFKDVKGPGYLTDQVAHAVANSIKAYENIMDAVDHAMDRSTRIRLRKMAEEGSNYRTKLSQDGATLRTKMSNDTQYKIAAMRNKVDRDRLEETKYHNRVMETLKKTHDDILNKSINGNSNVPSNVDTQAIVNDFQSDIIGKDPEQQINAIETKQIPLKKEEITESAIKEKADIITAKLAKENPAFAERLETASQIYYTPVIDKIHKQIEPMFDPKMVKETDVLDTSTETQKVKKAVDRIASIYQDAYTKLKNSGLNDQQIQSAMNDGQLYSHNTDIQTLKIAGDALKELDKARSNFNKKKIDDLSLYDKFKIGIRHWSDNDIVTDSIISKKNDELKLSETKQALARINKKMNAYKLKQNDPAKAKEDTATIIRIKTRELVQKHPEFFGTKTKKITTPKTRKDFFAELNKQEKTFKEIAQKRYKDNPEAQKLYMSYAYAYLGNLKSAYNANYNSAHKAKSGINRKAAIKEAKQIVKQNSQLIRRVKSTSVNNLQNQIKKLQIAKKMADSKEEKQAIERKIAKKRFELQQIKSNK